MVTAALESSSRPLAQPQPLTLGLTMVPPPSAPRPLLLRVITALGWCALGLSLVGLAGYGGYGHRYLELISHGRAQWFALSLGGVGLFVGVEVWRQRSHQGPTPTQALGTSLSLFCLGLNLTAIIPWYFPPAVPGGEAPALRCLMANVYGDNNQYDRLLDLVAATQPDVLVVVEFTPQWSRALEPLNPLFPHQQQVPRSDNFGLALYSRIPLDNLRVDSFGSPGLPTIVADLTWGDRPLSLYAVHPPPPVSPQGFALRNGMLAHWAETIPQNPQPVVMLGDWNLSPWSPYYGEFLAKTGLHNSSQGFGIQPTWPVAGVLPQKLQEQTGQGATPGFPPRPPWPWGQSLLQIPIDHGLISPGLRSVNFWRGPAIGSDHYPILVDLVWNNPTAQGPPPQASAQPQRLPPKGLKKTD